MKYLHVIAFILLVVGGLNWGLTGLGFNVVNMILGSVPSLEMIVYLLVGASAVYIGATHMKDCKHCSAGGQMM